MHHLCALLSAAALTAVSSAAVTPRNNDNDNRYKYVAAFSVDGMHGSDVEKYVAARPKSTIAGLLENGYEYTNAFTSAPSDSFPGTLAQFTGSGPRTTGVWYDDAWDRSLYAPRSMCKGAPGAESKPRVFHHCWTWLTMPSHLHWSSRLRLDKALLWWHQPGESPHEAGKRKVHATLSTCSSSRQYRVWDCTGQGVDHGIYGQAPSVWFG